MGWVDQFEDWPPYRRLWERWPGQPWTHAFRDWLQRDLLHMGIFGAACFAAGLFASSLSFLAALVVILVVCSILAHLFF
jgi:hypothetical protein